MGIMNDTVQYRVCDSFITYHVIPSANRELRIYDQGRFAMPVFNNFHQGSPALRIEGLYGEVIQYKQLPAFKFCNLLDISSIRFSHFKLGKDFWRARI